MHRHQYIGRKFGREKGHREAMLKNLAASLILHEKVETTVAKAKEIRPIVEKMITMGKKGTLAARRQLLKSLPENAAAKVMEKLAPHYLERPGGYTRILKTGYRVGDGAEMAMIEFVDLKAEPKKEEVATSKVAKKAPKKTKEEEKIEEEVKGE
jgi:large subunit ribosomal protein L17